MVLRFLFLLVLVTSLHAEDGVVDPEFDKVPFAQWLSGGPQASLKWSEHLLPVILSVHQRLLARMQIQLDGAEAARRRGEGELVFFFQLTDAAGRIYQDHTSYSLEKVERGLKASDLLCTESAFVLPGEYSIAVAIYDTATKEHAVKKDKLHVPAMKPDPLADAWRDLPEVEFIPAAESPDRWFAPRVEGKLHLALTPRRPLRVEVVMNLTPSETESRPYGIQERNFSFLIPTLKVISQIDSPQVMLNVSLLDLARRRVAYRQDQVRSLDWDKVRKSLSDAGSGMIDVKSLADRQHNGAFFVKEVATRMAGDEPCAVIVLSGPMTFAAEQDVPNIEVRPAADSKLFYIRLQQSQPGSTGPPLPPGRRRRRMSDFPIPPGFPPEPENLPLQSSRSSLRGNGHDDQLAAMLKPLDPHLFDVSSAEQLRKALAAILGAIDDL